MNISRLGKGLESLFGQQDIDSSFVLEDKYQNIPIDLIEPNPYQPRKNFNKDSLNELAESIKQQGLLQPIVVRPDPTDTRKYQIVAGERRWRACQIIHMDLIPAIVLDVTDEDLMLVALVENLQREDLDPIEEAEAIQKALEILKVNHEELAKKLGKSRTSVTNSLRLLKLDEEIRESLKKREISVGQARPLLGIEDKDIRLTLYRAILELNLTSREVEEAVSYWKKNKSLPENIMNKPTIKKQKHKRKTISHEFLSFKKEIQQILTKTFHVPTKIVGDFDKGKIVINYSSQEELKSVLKKLRLNT